MDPNDAGRIIITWTNLCKTCGLDPERKSSFTAAERKEILADVSKRLDDWIAGIGPFKGAPISPIDPEFLKKAPKVLHTIFTKRGDSLKLDALAAFYCAQSEEDEDIEEVRENLRKLVKLEHEVFALGSGGSPEVVRLKTAQGKATQAERPKERAARGTANSAGKTGNGVVQRYTARVVAIGYKNKRDFERARGELGGAPTLRQLEEWAAKHLH